MVNPMNRTEKRNVALMTGKKMKKTWGKQPNFLIKINGKRGFKWLSLSGRSFCVCPRADALFDLDFGVWILDLFFFAFWDVMGKQWTAQKKKDRKKEKHTEKTNEK